MGERGKKKSKKNMEKGPEKRADDVNHDNETATIPVACPRMLTLIVLSALLD